MDDNKIIDLLLRLLEKVAGLESKIDSNNALHLELREDVRKLEGRICKIEQAPGMTWGALKTAILTGIGTIVAGGIVYAVVSAIKK